MFKIKIFIIILFTASTAFSWEPTFWFGTGAAFENFGSNEFSNYIRRSGYRDSLNFDPGFSINTGATLTLSSQLALHTGASLLINKIKFPRENRSNPGGYQTQYEESGFQINLTSIEISPMVRAYLSNRSPSVYIAAGINVSYLLRCDQSSYDARYDQRSRNRTFECLNAPNVSSSNIPTVTLKHMEYALLGGFGISNMYNEHLYISIDFTYKYGLNSISESRGLNIKRSTIIVTGSLGIPI